MPGFVAASVVTMTVTSGVGVAFTVSVDAGTGVPSVAAGVSFAVSTVVGGGVATGLVVHPQDAMRMITIINKPMQVFIN